MPGTIETPHLARRVAAAVALGHRAATSLRVPPRTSAAGARSLRGALLIGLTLAVSLIACGSSQESTTQVALQKAADTDAINQIEIRWHEASSLKNLDMMMSLWTDNGVLTSGSQTYTGKDQIRSFFATQASSFKPENHWISETPSYKIRISVNGDTGTLYFECHFVNVDTGRLMNATAMDGKVVRVNGQWLIASGVGGAVAVPLTP